MKGSQCVPSDILAKNLWYFCYSSIPEPLQSAKGLWSLWESPYKIIFLILKRETLNPNMSSEWEAISPPIIQKYSPFILNLNYYLTEIWSMNTVAWIEKKTNICILNCIILKSDIYFVISINGISLIHEQRRLEAKCVSHWHPERSRVIVWKLFQWGCQIRTNSSKHKLYVQYRMQQRPTFKLMGTI